MKKTFIFLYLLAIAILWKTSDAQLGADPRVLTPRQGGTGTSTLPSDNAILIGNGTEYGVKVLTPGTGVTFSETGSTLTVNSTATGGADFSFDPIYNGTINSTSTTLLFNNGFISSASSSVAGTLFVSALNLGGTTFTTNNISQWNNDAGYLTSIPADPNQTFTSVTSSGLVVTGTSTLGYATSTSLGTSNLNIGSDHIVDITGSGLSVTAGTLNVSGLTTSNFSSANISQWTNNSGYLISSDINNHTFNSITSGNITITGTTSLQYATSTGFGITGKFVNTSSATSTFTGGIYANALQTNLPNCDTLDTNSSGALICGSDNMGFSWTHTSGQNLNSTSSILSFTNGFISSASSSIAGNLFVSDAVNASSTLHINGTGRFAGDLYVRKVYGGTTTATDLNLYGSPQAFDLDNTGRVRLGERIDISLSNTTGETNTVNTDMITVGGTIHSSSTVTVLSALKQTTIVKYSSAQILSTAPAFSANSTFIDTAGVINTGSLFLGFHSGLQYQANVASGYGKADNISGINSAPLVSETGAGSAYVGNLAGFSTYANVLLINHFTNSSGVVALKHYQVGQPNITSSIGLGSQYGLYIPSLTAGTTTNTGIYSGINRSTTVPNWFLYGAGTASSTLAGALGVGTTTLNYTGGLTIDGSLITGGDTPSLVSCGTSPTIRGNNTAGEVVMGSSPSGNSCTLNFSKRFAKRPSCVFSGQHSKGYRGTSTQTYFVVSSTSTPPAGSIINYHCLGVE